MFLKLLAIFIGIPIIELGILIKLGQEVGLLPTLGLIVVTGFIGAVLTRYQGWQVMTRIEAELQVGRVPAEELLDGVMILIGGIVLLTPGLLTDLLGFLLLIPSTRQIFKKRLQKKLESMVKSGETRVTYVIH